MNGDQQSSARGEYQSYTQPAGQFEIVRFVRQNSNTASSQKYGVLQFEPRGKTFTARPIGSYYHLLVATIGRPTGGTSKLFNTFALWYRLRQGSCKNMPIFYNNVIR